MLNLSLRLLSGGVLLLLCLSACIPVPMTTPELYRPLSYFDPVDNITEYENQLARFNVAIEADATDMDARFARALLYMGVGKYLPAEDDLTAAIKLADRRPGYSKERLASIYVHRGLLRWNAEQIDLAIADYSRAIELDPEDWEAYFHRWQAYNHHEEAEKAEQDREQGMKLKPSVFKKEYVLRYDGIVLN
ncbi:hypothetical protein [Gimesia sp.]|uniref:hypothetical protein n=1 Tax=Gimesia sp. TaxID=2024833 RepID=UPI003A90F0BA